ncbi:IQ-domain 1 [Striga asiatica]|uniref:IQ-domain 1 n=1 Tax=Striga asiatica TaxID=4170 RepID=A0A5A7PXE5_STRAF|nr:IQ-domain 1 [Striga asiatica]
MDKNFRHTVSGNVSNSTQALSSSPNSHTFTLLEIPLFPIPPMRYSLLATSLARRTKVSPSGSPARKVSQFPVAKWKPTTRKGSGVEKKRRPPEYSRQDSVPLGAGTSVASSKWKGQKGNVTRRVDRLRGLHTTKQEEVGDEKQRRPPADETRAEEDRFGGREREAPCQELAAALSRGHIRENWGWERRMREERGGRRREEKAERGEERRKLKCLQVDLRVRRVLRGRKERTSSRRCSGRRLHIRESIIIFFCG